MSDNGFDFRPPPARRESKPFEPPPWEQDAFEELQRRKAAEEAEIQGHAATGETEPRLEPAPAPAAVEAPEPKAEETVSGPEPREKGSKAELDEHRVRQMLELLKAEEPDVRRGIGGVWIAAALFVGAMGAVLLIWGMAAMAGSRTTGEVGRFGGGILLVFGAGFVGAAVWLIYKALRQRGVL